MQFIIFPGKDIGSKLPVNKTSWYNDDYIKAFLKCNVNESVHYYKSKIKTNNDYVLSSATRSGSVEISLCSTKALQLNINYIISKLNTKTKLVDKKVINTIKLSCLDLDGIKLSAESVFDHIYKSDVVDKKINITHSPLEDLFFYTIVHIEKIKIDKHYIYKIKTNNPNMLELQLPENVLPKNVKAFDVIIVKDNKPHVLARADFYKFYRPSI